MLRTSWSLTGYEWIKILWLGGVGARRSWAARWYRNAIWLRTSGWHGKGHGSLCAVLHRALITIDHAMHLMRLWTDLSHVGLLQLVLGVYQRIVVPMTVWTVVLGGEEDPEYGPPLE